MDVMIASHYPADLSRPAGGQDVVTLRLLRGLQAYPDINVQVLTAARGSPDIDRAWKQDRVAIQVVSFRKKKFVHDMFSLAARITPAIRLADPDLVHVHMTDYAYGAVKSGYPVVMTMHSIAWRERLISRGGVHKYLALGYELYIERVILSRLRHVIAIAPNIAAYVRAKSRAKVYEIPVAIDPEFFAVSNHEVTGRLLFVGQIYPRKGVLPLLESFDIIRHKVPGAQLDIIGNPLDSEYLAAMNAYIQTHQMEGQVRYLGRVDEMALKRAYAECSVMVLSALEEGTPAVLLEAMAAGKPVVATRVGGIPSIVEDGSNGFLAAVNDVQGFAERVIDLLSNRDLRQQMGQAAQQRARRHRLEVVTAQIVEVYRDVLREMRHR